MEPVEATTKKPSFKRLCVRFAEKTSMQGVPYINSAKLGFAKLLWTLLLLCAIGFLVFHLYYLCTQFFSWPKVTKISLGFDNLRLPQVTICNSNAIRKSRLSQASPELQDLVNDVHPDTMTLPLRNKQFLDKDRNKRSMQNVKQMNLSRYNVIDFREQFEDYSGLGPKDDMAELDHTFRSLYMSEPRENRIDMGHDIHDMLVSCSFNGRTCYPENFTTFNTVEYGNCFTLKPDHFIVKQSGPKAGLQLMLYLENEEYLDGIADGYGARMVLNNKHEIPFPADEGFFLHSFAENDIALKLIKISRLGSPHGSCESGRKFRRAYGRPYTRQACQSLWETTYILRHCKCYDEMDEELFVQSRITNLTECGTESEIECVDRIRSKFHSKEIKPICQNPCSESLYVRTITTRPWPTDSYLRFLLKSVCEDQPSKCATLKSYDGRQLGLNFVKVTLYYEDLNYEEITEEPEIQDAQFLSDLGGALGLWIGLSVLSIFEVLQFLLELCRYFVHKCQKSGEHKPNLRNDKKEKYENEPIKSSDTYRNPTYEGKDDTYSRKPLGDYSIALEDSH